MEGLQRRIFILISAPLWVSAAAFLAALAFLLSDGATSARAGLGYELDATKPKIGIPAESMHGVAVDQESQRIYVAVESPHAHTTETGWVEQLESNGTPTADSPFTAGPNAFFSGVAVNPVTHGIYASRAFLETDTATFGEARVHQFSSSGVPGTSFALPSITGNPQIAADATGRLYFPNQVTNSIEVFNSSGTLLTTITCGGCPGGSFAWPASVAVDSTGHVYVADIETGFVAKLKPASESYGFDSLVQSNHGAAAVAVDPSTGDVFVGDTPEERNYHIVAYNSSGVQFDDFAAGIVGDPDPELGIGLAAQIAVNGTTHKLYVSDNGGLWVFERTTIHPPTASLNPPTAVGQVSATLNATVDVKGHAALECKFELVDAAHFSATGFNEATSLSCPKTPNEVGSRTIEVGKSGLSPSTTYHYRLTVTTNAGSVQSVEKTLETLPLAPPTVTTEAAFGVTKSVAALAGKVNPHGGLVSVCRFKFGTTLSYEAIYPCSSLPGPVTTDVAEVRGVSGLVDGATYHYRLMVTTNAGTAEGSDVEFTAVDPYSPPTPSPVVPPPLVSPPPPAPGPVAPRRLRCKKGFQKKKVRGKLRCVKRKRHVAQRRPHRSS